MQPLSIKVRNGLGNDIYTIEQVSFGLRRPRDALDFNVVGEGLVEDGDRIQKMKPGKHELQ